LTPCSASAATSVRETDETTLLTDNGKQLTDRFGRDGEVLFDRTCRDNGIVHRLTTPTTTGKVERLHQTF
jgi:hypothetical protein